MSQPRILITFGTRPEAIKMAPLVAGLKAHPDFKALVCVTAQHREMLDQVLGFFGINPDFDLDLMQKGSSLDELAALMLLRFGKLLDTVRPDRVLVHGDTLTTMIASLASYFRKIPVAHVEAGLRSGDNYAPWPEEVDRKIADIIADLHFAPTKEAAASLESEGIGAHSIHVTGNTVIDALFEAQRRLSLATRQTSPLGLLKTRFKNKRIIAVTTHRRESLGSAMREIALALREIAQRRDVAIILPVHPNPLVLQVMREQLGDHHNIALIDPLGYADFVELMSIAEIILTDSGGVQEEAPALGKPLLVLREKTERPEGIEAGTARLVGTNRSRIVQETSRLLDDPGAYSAMARAHNPYGDGRATGRIVAALEHKHGIKPVT